MKFTFEKLKEVYKKKKVLEYSFFYFKYFWKLLYFYFLKYLEYPFLYVYSFFIKDYKIVVYTFIFNMNRQLIEPKKYKNVKYVCFTDNKKLKSKVWEIKYFNKYKNPRLNCKFIKMHPFLFFKNYKYIISIDSNIKLILPPKVFVKRYLVKNDMAIFKHPFRNCVYEEAKACINLKKAPEKIVNKQISKYKSEGYPKNNGLTDTCVILLNFERNDIKYFLKEWFKENYNFSTRDQLSFNYVLEKYKHRIRFKKMNYYSRINPFLKFYYIK